MSGAPAIAVDALSVRFGAYVALENISLALTAGENVALVGASGSGKSTLLRAVAGLVAPSAGAVRIFGADIAVPAARQAARQRTGFIFQDLNLYRMKTALENCIVAPMAIKAMPREEAMAKALAALDRVGCRALADRHPFELSGGQQQRVAIARALVMEPDILLLDEPTASLDPELVRGALHLLQDVGAKMTVLCATHEMAFARELATRAIVLANGRIVREGRSEEVLG